MEGAGSGAPVHFFDDHRPRCHLAPPAGWMNDPNGPVFYKGRYHMFYQHLPDACEWDFGIVWGHAVSSDLVHWEHLPPALVPTPGWVDADGCFSGCCIVDPTGRPVILYTGVRLRSNAAAGPLPPPEQDLGMVWIESQCVAVPADPDDDLLVGWTKVERPFLPLPPADMHLTGWRDPFVFAANTLPTEATARSPTPFGPPPAAPPGPPHYRILMGSGIKGKGGTALVYRTADLMAGWELEGTLCEGSSEDTGVVWECPLLVPLDPVPHGLRSRHPYVPPPWLHPALGAVGAAAPVRPPPPLRHPSGGPLAALNAQPVASPAAAQDDKPMATISSLSEGMPLRGSASVGGAAAAAAMSPPPPPPADGENADASAFEFSSSGAPSPADLARSGSIELWPSSGEQASSPVEEPDAVSPTFGGGAQRPAPQQRRQGEKGGAQQAQQAGGADRRLVAELAAKLERAATLEHWTEEGDSSEGTSATIGSKLSSVAGSALGAAAAPARAGSAASALTSAFRPPPPHSPFSEDADDDGTDTGTGTAAASEDRFDAAFARMPALQVRRPLRSEPSAGPSDLLPPDAADAALHLPPRQWHFFTVSPDAPTNPVLYWTGFVGGDDGGAAPAAAPPRFEIESAKGPYRLDLGDILYAPNVCQDAAGRWLLWGWLQERRKMGSYAYAGCLSLPRVLHVTDEGRLLQAPAPEVAGLRAGAQFHAQHVTLYPEAVMPLQRVSGERLDIEVTIERGSAMAAGLLFRSHEAEAEGSTCIVYDWDRNQLEAIFNVPPNWQPTGVPAAALHRPDSQGGDLFEGDGGFDPASYLCSTPRFPLSRVQSASVFSPLSASPRVPQDGASVPSSPGTSGGLSFAGGQSLTRTGSSLAQCLQRTGSFANLGAAGGPAAAGTFSPDSGSGGGGLGVPVPGAGGPTGGPGGLFRTSSTLGASIPRVGSFMQRQTSFMAAGSPRGSQAAADAAEAAEMDAELSMLLEDLAAPMRGAAEEPPAPPPEPRRVGGPLLMRPADRLHLRIFVDHSLVEVFTGTGEVLSTRVYRGQPPEPEVPGHVDAGIEFVAFGGAAIVEKVSAWEVGSAWEGPSATPRSAKAAAAATAAAAAAAAAAAGSAVATPLAAFVAQSPGGAAARADELFDEILMSIAPGGVVAVGAAD